MKNTILEVLMMKTISFIAAAREVVLFRGLLKGRFPIFYRVIVPIPTGYYDTIGRAELFLIFYDWYFKISLHFMIKY